MIGKLSILLCTIVDKLFVILCMYQIKEQGFPLLPLLPPSPSTTKKKFWVSLSTYALEHLYW